MATTLIDKEYQKFTQNIKTKTGIDLSLYKEAQMKRRLTALRDKKGFSNFDEFYDALSKDKVLYQAFLDRMTINVSEFFRNKQRWDTLNKVIFTFKSKQIKSWSAACSTGEEPYTLAMILDFYFPNIKADILATDIDETAIEKAKEGIYTAKSIKEMPQDIMKRYFSVENNLYYIKPEIKNKIKYKRQDLLVDSFENGYDLIICRNVMIYFTDEAKNLLYKKFSESLKPGGYLFVGSTEQIFNPIQFGFELYDNFFYRKKI